MIAPLRRAHRVVFIVLAVCIPALFVAAVLARRSGHLPERESPAIAEPRSTDEIEGCWGTLPVRLRVGARDQEREGPSTNEPVLSGEELIWPAPLQPTVTGVSLTAPPRHPHLFAYWVPEISDAGAGLHSGAQQLARLSAYGATDLNHPQVPAHGATLALYSLGHDETIGVIRLRPQSIVLRTCG